jgi:threonyl-tRNA synthetase
MQKTSRESDLFNIRHSLAHVLLMAIKHHFPHALPTIGPVTETGFYYDIDFVDGVKIKEEDLAKVEKTMKEILMRHLDFKVETVTPDVARELFSVNSFKKEIINMIETAGEDVTLYRTGEDFFDLCEGPHVSNTQEIPVDGFKLTHLAGAYWRGDEKNPMLTRIYGLAFDSKEALDAYVFQQEEAKKRDHRLLGRQLKLFTFSDLVGPGLPLWTPRGTILRKKVDDYVQELRAVYDYGQVTIPHITKNDLYKKSGHWEKYAEDLFKIDTRDGHTLCMKPMNCPHHAQIYASELRSYKELPIRYSETTMVYRDEQSGELSGLQRVLSITQDDAHVFCRESQLEEEINNIWDLIEKFYGTFGFNKLTPRFSRRDSDPKFKGADVLWQKAEGAIKNLIEKRAGTNWTDGEGEAAFYGPKVDFMAHDSLGRTWQVGTIQIDFVQPNNFGLECVNELGLREGIVMIHCAIAGSLERFLSIYIEHTAGNFPLWIAPMQLSIIPIGEAHHDYAKKVQQELKGIGIRVELLDEKDGLGKKVRKVKEMKTPYWLVIGDKDIEAGKVTLESRDVGQIGQVTVDELVEKLTEEIRGKK